MPDGGLRAKKKRSVPIANTYARSTYSVGHITEKFAAIWKVPHSAVKVFVEEVLNAYRKTAPDPGSASQCTKQSERGPEPGASPSGPPREAGLLATYRPFGSRMLPDLPPGFYWPNETYSGSPEARQSRSREGGGIVAYLDRVWLPLLNAGVATRRILEIVDPSAIAAITNFTKTNPRTGERRQLPDSLHFPTLKEINDALLAAAPDLARVAANRRATGRQSRGLKQAAE
jgi:hypothetical protein